jgi:uncharacterized membrane protein
MADRAPSARRARSAAGGAGPVARGSAAGRTTGRPGLASFVVALLGLAASAYLTVEHFTAGASFACPETAAINCQKVTTSAWSHVGPVPVAVLGLAFFVGMTLLCSPPAWRVRALGPLRVAGAVLGVLTALGLVWVELFQVDAICLWCTAVHVCALALLATVLWTSSSMADHTADR